MRLYYAPFTCSLAAHIALREAGLTFSLERVDTKHKRTETGADFTALHPKAYVPLLQLADGQLLSEGPAILLYIAQRSGAAALAPEPGSFLYYRLLEWLSFVSSELHKQFAPLFAAGSSPAQRQRARELLQRRIAVLEQQLSREPYLLGSTFSVADAYAFVVLRWARWVQLSLTPFPAVCAFQERVEARPAVQDAMARERQKT